MLKYKKVILWCFLLLFRLPLFSRGFHSTE
uniref:Uncharacterized protein n=1 Tax=Rhizophora mucronata TaxID=61149 RepID=A0A2P2NWS0_RHIMU